MQRLCIETVRRALQRGSAPRRVRKRRGSKLEPYRATIDRLLSENVWNAVVILREIQAERYSGGLTVLRQYIAPKRQWRALRPPGRATVRFESRPGQQLQSDWGRLLGGMLRRFCWRSR
jgi:transposase